MRSFWSPIFVIAASVILDSPYGYAQSDTVARPNASKEPRPQQNFEPPKVQKPDADTLKQVADKTEELRAAIVDLKKKNIPDHVLIEVEIYLKAAENIVRFEEWYAAASGKWVLATLNQGLLRAQQAGTGTAVWGEETGKWVIRAYRSYIDDSIQPYAVLLPSEFYSKTDWRMDVVLHGRDSSLTESKFIATHAGDAPNNLDFVQLEVYGRGNNAYRWAGEVDVFEAILSFEAKLIERKHAIQIDPNRVVLRGFSMGGAGTWHIGLHHPDRFCVLGPGAGFTTTRTYIPNFPNQLPEYIEKCLHIYDAVDYAENAFNVPIVAYSGEKDPQRMAATNIETALKEFKEPLQFKHLIAPGLEHLMPPEWQRTAELEYRKYTDAHRPTPDRVRFVTYTPKYGRCDWVWIDALQTTFDRAIVDATRIRNTFRVTTENVQGMLLWLDDSQEPIRITIDKQLIKPQQLEPATAGGVFVERVDGIWSAYDLNEIRRRSQGKRKKHATVQGPVDDAFTRSFVVVPPAVPGFHQVTSDFISTSEARFERIWDKYFRGQLPIRTVSEINLQNPQSTNLILFGDPQSNQLIADMLRELPITWTKDELRVNGLTYDSTAHVPVMIYPNPKNPEQYVVINSGHTFQEADLKGTNALLYPRLGDWAVLKLTPDGPNESEVVAAGLFDENWQFVPAHPN